MTNDANNRLSYVLITPARNEGKYIETTIRSVTAQTVIPKKWVIVSDGSTDKTDQIVMRYAASFPWLELLRMPANNRRSFAAKVQCFNAGYKQVKGLHYDIIGNLDADISFEKDYFEFLVGKFAEIPELGVAGTPFVEGSVTYDYRFTNIEHVSGACQLFRRSCFEDIGGYSPIQGGGIDWVAVTTARMKGWVTRTFSEKVCFHLKGIGTGNGSQWGAWFRYGQKDYSLGNHPLWQISRSLYQMTKKPFLVKGSLVLLGYLWSALKRSERPISGELIAFSRGEQMNRLRRTFQKQGHRQGFQSICKVTRQTKLSHDGEKKW
jgi:glycosyltransferase involved in cell wall biosynthesis